MRIRNDLIETMQCAGGCRIKGIVDLEQPLAAIERRERILRRVLMPQKHESRQLRMRFEILERDGFRCRYCGRSVARGATLQIDHITPKSKNGQNTHSNYVTACSDCNLGKSDALLEPIRIWQLTGGH